LKHLGRAPGEEEVISEDLAAEQQIFSLKIATAVATASRERETLMLEELWNHYTAWDTIHLQKIIEIIISERWGPAL
jgi:hypothetical protein